jgi:hypothetical protein
MAEIQQRMTFNAETMANVRVTITAEPTMRYRIRIRLAIMFLHIASWFAGWRITEPSDAD